MYTEYNKNDILQGNHRQKNKPKKPLSPKQKHSFKK